MGNALNVTVYALFVVAVLGVARYLFVKNYAAKLRIEKVLLLCGFIVVVSVIASIFIGLGY